MYIYIDFLDKLMKRLTKDKYNNHINAISAALNKPHNHHFAQMFVANYLKDKDLSMNAESTIRKAFKNDAVLKKIPLKWPHKAPFRIIVTTSNNVENIDLVDLAFAFFDTSYLSFATALFFHGLTEQVVKSFYVSKERPTPRKNNKKVMLNNDTLRTEFLKPARKTQNICQYMGYTYYLVERGYAGYAGVVSKEIVFNKKKLVKQISGLERTLIDCAINPHYAGGLSELIKAFYLAKGNIKYQKLFDIYHSMSLIYPYWQRIGVILENVVSKQGAQTWKDYFGKPKNDFYIDKEYRSSWEFDNSWQIHYPKGIF